MKKIFIFFLSIYGMCDAQVFSENFDGNALPTGWTVENPDTSYNWNVGAQNGFASFPSGAAFFDDDDAGPTGINTNARLISPVINLTGVVNPKLSFNYANMIDVLDSTLKVEVFNGTSWIQVFTFSGEAGVWDLDFNTFSYVVTSYDAATNIDLTPYANPAFKLRFIYDDAGDYSYGVVVDNLKITSGPVLAASEVSHSDNIEIYPNPAGDNIHIKLDSRNKVEKVSVVDMSGKLIKTFDKESDTYDLSDMPKGAYIIMITNNNKEVLKKKIVKK
ncbi:T9SS type A sorting domain-containing protein [Chryseobacterium panacisoli]|uniref:T9SS type A sorting domain-containing protein n=1 Tax=Chryseobacterium panacisoli TaxID=1807141 RepID=A0A5D8ZM09_9FLAO|nr:T9SS type A sorting domain-containing protein [Chryseobacterium panacisoli]TZF96035.1 T9SS type A sorting domain-containing protein [Chryseobacterium panacisoli]